MKYDEKPKPQKPVCEQCRTTWHKDGCSKADMAFRNKAQLKQMRYQKERNAYREIHAAQSYAPNSD